MQYCLSSDLGISPVCAPPPSEPLTAADLVCTVCNKQYNTKRALREHLSIHIKKHTCEVCNKSFAKLQHLTTHRRLHTGERPFSCSVSDSNVMYLTCQCLES